MDTPLERDYINEQLSLEELEAEVSANIKKRQTEVDDALAEEEVYQEVASKPEPKAGEGRLTRGADPVEDQDDGFVDDFLEVVGTAAEETTEAFGRFAGQTADDAARFFGIDSENLLMSRITFTDDDKVGGMPVPFTDWHVNFFTPDEWKATVAEAQERGLEEMNLSNLDIPDVDRPDSTAGRVAADLVRYTAAFALTRRVLPGSGAGAGGVTRVLETAAQGGVAAYWVADPIEENMVDIASDVLDKDELPGFISWLQADSDDYNAMNRLRVAIPDAVLSAGVDAILAAGGSLVRSVRKAQKNAKQVREAEKYGVDDIDLDKAIKELDEAETAAKETAESGTEEAAEKGAKETAEQSAKETAEEAVDLAGRRNTIGARVERALKSQPELVKKVNDALKRGAVAEVEELLSVTKFMDIEELAKDMGDDPEALRNLIAQVSDSYEGLLETAGNGVQTLAQTRALAADLGVSVRQLSGLFNDVRGDKGLTARTLAARNTFMAIAAHTRRLAQRAGTEGATRADELAAMRAIDLMGLAHAKLGGTKREIARALHSFRQNSSAEAAMFDDLEEALTKMGRGGKDLRAHYFRTIGQERNVREFTKHMKRSFGRKVADAIVESYINGLLSATSTLTLNVASNTIKVIEEPLMRLTAVGLGASRNAVRRAFGKGALERTTLREVGSYVYGQIQGFNDAMRIPLAEVARGARKDFDLVRKLADAAEQGDGAFKRALQAAPAESEVVKSLREAENWGTFYRSAVEEAPITDTLQRVDVDTRKNIPGLWGTVIRLPGRGILASDEAFKSIAHRGELHTQAYRIASKEADEAGLKGAKRTKWMARRQGELLENPAENFPQLHHRAITHARYQTFQSALEPGGMARDFENFINRHPAMRFIVPFYRTPVNLVKQSIERTPLGLGLKNQGRRIMRDVAEGGAKGDLAASRILWGSGILGMSIFMAANGKIKGSGRFSPKIRNTAELDGVPPYSVKLADGTWVQFNRLDPFATILGLAADLYEGGSHYLETPEEQRDWEDAVGVAISAVTVNIVDKTWFKGVSDLVAVFNDPKQAKATTYVTNLGTTMLTPYSSLMRRIAVDQDKYAREAWDFMDKWQASLPGLSEGLPVRRDLLGNPEERTDYLGPAWFSPIAVGEKTDDIVYQNLAALEFDYRMPAKDLYDIGIDVTPEQYSRFLEIRGQEPLGTAPLYKQLEQLFQTSAWKRGMTKAQRLKTVKDMFSTATRRAKQRLLLEDKELRKTVQEYEIGQMQFEPEPFIVN